MLMEEALKNGHRIFYFEIKDIHIIQNKCFLKIDEILVDNNNNKVWFKKLKNLIVEPIFLCNIDQKRPPF